MDVSGKTDAGHVGDVVYWTLSGAFVDDGMLNAVYPPRLPNLIPPVTRRKAFTQAMKQFFSQKGVADNYIFMPVSRANRVNTYGVSKLTTVEDGVDGDASGRIYYDENTDTLGCSNHGICQAASAYIRQYLGLRPISDLRTIVLQLIRHCKGVSLRPTGGVYFVPNINDNMTMLGDLGTLVEAVAPGSALYRIPQVMFNDGRGTQFKVALETSVANDALGDLEMIMANAAETVTHEKFTANRFEKIKDVLGKLELYEDILGLKLENVKQRVVDTRKSLQELVTAALAPLSL